MFKKTKVLLASCAILAAASTVQAASYNAVTLANSLVANVGTAHPAQSATWEAATLATGPAGAEYVIGLGGIGTAVNLAVSTNQVTDGIGNMQLTVWSTGSSLADVNGGIVPVTWVEAQLGSIDIVRNPLDADDINFSFNAGGANMQVMAVSSFGTMDLSTSLIRGAGVAAPVPGSGLVEYDAVAVPAPAAALLMIPGLLGIIATRKKGLKTA